jgi:hypothetical protein
LTGAEEECRVAELHGPAAHIATVLTETQAGFKWCFEFFHAVQTAQWRGVYGEKEEWFRCTFREQISRDHSLLSPADKIPDTEWVKLYDYCLEKAKMPALVPTSSTTDRVAGLLTQVPIWRPVIDLFARYLRASTDPVERRDAIMPEFRALILKFIATPEIKNLDVEAIVWSDLYAYAWQRAQPYASALAPSAADPQTQAWSPFVEAATGALQRAESEKATMYEPPSEGREHVAVLARRLEQLLPEMKETAHTCFRLSSSSASWGLVGATEADDEVICRERRELLETAEQAIGAVLPDLDRYELATVRMEDELLLSIQSDPNGTRGLETVPELLSQGTAAFRVATRFLAQARESIENGLTLGAGILARSPHAFQVASEHYLNAIFEASHHVGRFEVEFVDGVAVRKIEEAAAIITQVQHR